jgi:hypothetical protein
MHIVVCESVAICISDRSLVNENSQHIGIEACKCF